ncbi:Methyltransferase-like protein 6 [Chamberlinius hualienensis]
MENFYVRQDGTKAYYFSKEMVNRVFTESGYLLLKQIITFISVLLILKKCNFFRGLNMMLMFNTDKRFQTGIILLRESGVPKYRLDVQVKFNQNVKILQAKYSTQNTNVSEQNERVTRFATFY